MAKVITQEYILKLTAQGLKGITKELKGLRRDISGIQGSTDKASQGLDKAGKSGDRFQKKLKGVGNLTANSTKAFSKMEQGMVGGLVPAYAVVAANVFALTAAFGALERAADFQVLIRGAEELANQTGNSLIGLSKSMREITDGAIDMKTALSSAAIASSAGFDNSTIEELTQVARNASVALGRDMTDALNRVFKGAIKAEPELLDELGIILRLEPATRKYAATLNKSVKDLTTFEKQQAVVNEVISQGEEKFSLLSDIDPNPFTKLAASFSILIDSALKWVAIPFGAVAEFLADNMLALGAAFVVFGSSIASAAIPGLKDLATNMAASSAKSSNLAISTAIGAEAFKEFSEAAGGTVNKLNTVRAANIQVVKSLTENGKKVLGKIYAPLTEELKRHTTAEKRLNNVIKISGKEIKRLDGFKRALNKTENARKLALIDINKNSKAELLQLESLNSTLKKLGNNPAFLKLRQQAAALQARIVVLKASVTQGFAAGFTGGLGAAREAFKGFEKNVLKAAGTTQIFGAATRNAAKGLFLASGALGSFLKFIPIIGQLTFAWTLLSGAVSKVYSFFVDTSGIDAVEEAIDKLNETLEESSKIAKKFKAERGKGLANIDKNTKAYIIQRNVLNNLNKEIESSIAVATEFEGKGILEFFGAGQTSDILKSTEDMAKIIKTLGFEKDIAPILEEFGDTSGRNRESVLKFSSAILEASKNIVKSKADYISFSETIDESVTALDKSLSSISTKFASLTDEQKAFKELSTILTSVQTGGADTNFEDIARKIEDLTGSSASLLGITEDSLIEIGKIEKDRVKLLKEINILEEENSKIVLGSRRNATLRNAKLEERKALLEEVNTKDERLAELANKNVVNSKKIVAGLKLALKNLQVIVNFQGQYNTQVGILNFELKNANNSYTKQLSIQAKLNKLNKENIRVSGILLTNSFNTLKTDEKDLSNRKSKLEFDKLGATGSKKLAITNELLTVEQAITSNALNLNNIQLQRLALTNKQAGQSRKFVTNLEGTITKLSKQQLLGVNVDSEIASYTEKWKAAIAQLAKETGENGGDLLSSRQGGLDAAALKDKIGINIGSTQSLEQTASGKLAAQEQTALFKLQQEVLAETGDILDRQADKELRINELLLQREMGRLNAIAFLQFQGEQFDLLQVTLQKIAEIEGRSEQAKTTQIQKDKTALDNRISSLKLENKLAEIKLKGTKAVTRQEKIQLAIAIAQAKLKKKISPKEIKEITKALDINAAQEFADAFKGIADNISPIATEIQNLNNLLETTATKSDKINASFVTLRNIGEKTGNKVTQGMAEIGIAVQKFNESSEDSKDTWGLMEGVVGGLKTAFAGNEKAMAALQVATDVLALKAAVTAVLTAGEAPFPANFAAMAAVAGAAASLLGSIGVSFGGSQEVQGAQGVQDFKDSFGAQGVQGVDLQTNSLVDSIDVLIDIETDLFSVQRDLQVAVVNLTDSFDAIGASLFQAGGQFDAGNVVDLFGVTFSSEANNGFLGAFGSSRSNELIAAGIQFGATISFVADGIATELGDANFFLSEQLTKSSSGFFGIGASSTTWIRTTFRDIPEAVREDLQTSLENTAEVLEGLFGTLGNAANISLALLFDNIEDVVIPNTLVNLSDKGATEQGETVAAFFSNLSNQVIKNVTPFLTKFAKAGEELTDTLIRVAEETIKVDNILKKVGATVGDFSSGASFNLRQSDLNARNNAFQELVDATLTPEIAENITSPRIEEIKDQIHRTFLRNWEELWFGIGDLSSGGFRRRREVSAELREELQDEIRAEFASQQGFREFGSVDAWIESLKVETFVAWQDALVSNFKDVDELGEVFEKFSTTIFSESELAEIAVSNAENTIASGLALITKQLTDAGELDLLALLSEGVDADSLRQVFDLGNLGGAFSASFDLATGEIDTSGADLFATLIQMGAAFGQLQDAIEELDNAANDFNKDILRQIEAFGLLGKELDLLELSFDFEDTMKEAEEAGGDIALVEELFGLKRLEIIKEYNQEILDALDDGFANIQDSVLEVVSSFSAWDNVIFQGLKVEKMAARLKTSLGALASNIDLTVFEDIVDIQGQVNFEELFGSLITFAEEIPVGLEEQISLVEELRGAVMERYNSEIAMLETMKQLSIDIKGYLDDLFLSDKSPLTNAAQLTLAEENFAQNLKDVLSPDADVAAKASADLLGSADTLLELASGFWAIGPEFQAIFDSVVTRLSGVDDSITEEFGLSDETLAINAIQETALSQLATLDNILLVLQGENTAAFEAEIEAFKTALDDSIILDRISTRLDSLAGDIWQPIVSALTGVSSFDVGTNEVKFDQLAQVHKGEMILTPQTSESIRSGESIISANPIAANGGTNYSNTEVVNAIKILTEVVAVTQESIIDNGEELIQVATSTGVTSSISSLKSKV